MQAVTTIGLDIAKSVFQVHGIDAASRVVIRRQLRRSRVLGFFRKLSPCVVGIEACASSHHWLRELKALGHTVRLMPPAYVKPYLKRQKNDAADAEAICEAVQRPSMRFVETKTPNQQNDISAGIGLPSWETRKAPGIPGAPSSSWEMRTGCERSCPWSMLHARTKTSINFVELLHRVSILFGLIWVKQAKAIVDNWGRLMQVTTVSVETMKIVDAMRNVSREAK